MSQFNQLKNFRKSKNAGYALLELIFYVSFFAAMALVVTNAMLTMAGSFKETALHAKLSESAMIVERMVREVRGADSIVVAGAGNLKLNTTDDVGSPRTVEFLVSGTNLEFLEDDAPIGNLNAPGLAVSSLSFSEITTLKGKAVKISLSLQSESDQLGRTFDFYDTVVLRGGY